MTEEIKTEISTDCSYYKDVVKEETIIERGCIHCSLCYEDKECYLNRCKRLEQENKVLQAYKDINEDFKKAWNELNEKYKQLRSALEKIKKLNNNCADCDGIACGVCSNAEGKPNNSYKIANNALGVDNE